MPTEIAFSTGGSVKVTASVQEVADAIDAHGSTLDTARFAGFRGDEAVGGERVVVAIAAIAYAQEIRQP